MGPSNSALNLYAALGVHLGYFKTDRNASYTKKGPGRRRHNCGATGKGRRHG